MRIERIGLNKDATAGHNAPPDLSKEFHMANDLSLASPFALTVCRFIESKRDNGGVSDAVMSYLSRKVEMLARPATRKDCLWLVRHSWYRTQPGARAVCGSSSRHYFRTLAAKSRAHDRALGR